MLNAKKRKALGWTLVAAQLIAVALVVSLFVPVYKDICIPNEYTHAIECAQHHLGPFVFLWVVLIADAHNDLVSAMAAILIAAFTWTLYKATIQQAETTDAALKLARDEFNATHRPKLVVREVDITWVRSITEVSFVIINEGDSSAHNIDCEFRMTTRLAGIDGLGYKITLNSALPDLLAPGKSIDCRGPVAINMPDIISSLEVEAEMLSLAFEGFANYSGPTGLARRSAYYRPWGAKVLRFRPSDDPEREYPG